LERHSAADHKKNRVFMSFKLYKDTNGTIRPFDDDSKEKLDKVEYGEIFVCKRASKRNYELLKKYWALMSFAYENMPERFTFVDMDDMEEEILKAIGWKYVSKDFHGNEVIKAKSISYDKLPDDEVFSKIYDRCHGVICRLIGIDEEKMEELMRFI